MLFGYLRHPSLVVISLHPFSRGADHSPHNHLPIVRVLYDHNFAFKSLGVALPTLVLFTVKYDVAFTKEGRHGIVFDA